MKEYFETPRFSFSVILSDKKTLQPTGNTAETSWKLNDSEFFDPSFLRIWIILKGSGRVKTHFGEFDVTENNVYFMPPNSIVSTFLYDTMEQYFIDFVQDYNEFPIDQMYDFKKKAAPQEFDLILKLAESLYPIYKKDDFLSRFTVSSTLTTILTHFIRNTSQNYGKLENAVKYILKNYRENISMVYLANICDYSPEYFSAKFKSTFGVSPQKYIISKRINNAKILLISTEYPISVIGEKVGYPDPMHFSKLFTKETNISPSSYRKQYRKNTFSRQNTQKNNLDE